MKRLLLSSVALLGAISLAATALAADGDAGKEAATAVTHAQLAAASQSIAVTDMHLHHVINCLVGPHGRGFDAKAGNPCKGMGNGAVRDSSADKDLHSKTLKALMAARHGVATKDLSAAHDAASKVADILGSGGM
ncbi:MAG TPA: hypothetical protein VMU52_07715 [Steroidobacteraceae bacterium]|nr:hypothetical protein [Steroidobacteraceae bacterium]